ncbi:TIGR03118 family protein [Paraflavitalea soli]|nr:TIGR03118 family protein [Paraflavitalea soli]
MQKITRRLGSSGYPYALLCAVLIFVAGCKKLDELKQLKNFEQVNLVGNNQEYNPAHVDPTLINGWGIAFSATGTPWVNSQGGHVSEVYDREGVIVRPPVNIPSPGGPTGGNPTGIVFNGGADFVLSNGQAARFIFVGVDGILSAWNGAAGNNALLIKNDAATAAYTGLTNALMDGNNYLYAADFRANKIVVWDKNFAVVNMPFKDPGIPSGYAPFNIQAVGEWLYVTYAKVGPQGRSAAGRGLGFVSIFKTNGTLVKRFASRGALNAPWGIALASPSFFDDMDDAEDQKMKGATEGRSAILVGNFGDGYINAYTDDGQFIGVLRSNGRPIQIEGLWAITFPPSTSTIDPNRLYFAAGPDEEMGGLFGYIKKQ